MKTELAKFIKNLEFIKKQALYYTQLYNPDICRYHHALTLTYCEKEFRIEQKKTTIRQKSDL